MVWRCGLRKRQQPQTEASSSVCFCSFQWRLDTDCSPGLHTWNAHDKTALEHELADVLAYLLRLSTVCNIDLSAAWERKMQLNRLKYRPQECFGSSAKYTKYTTPAAAEPSAPSAAQPASLLPTSAAEPSPLLAATQPESLPLILAAEASQPMPAGESPSLPPTSAAEPSPPTGERDVGSPAA
jgi:hypothetical protein